MFRSAMGNMEIIIVGTYIGIFVPIMENQMEGKVKNDMEPGIL